MNDKEYVDGLYSLLVYQKQTNVWASKDGKIEFIHFVDQGWEWNWLDATLKEIDFLDNYPNSGFNTRKQAIEMLKGIGFQFDERIQKQNSSVWNITGILDIFGHEGNWIMAPEISDPASKHIEFIKWLNTTPMLDKSYPTKRACLVDIVKLLPGDKKPAFLNPLFEN